MATPFKPKKIILTNINNGNRFEEADTPSPSTFNDPIEASAYSQKVSEEALTNAKEALEIVIDKLGTRVTKNGEFVRDYNATQELSYYATKEFVNAINGKVIDFSINTNNNFLKYDFGLLICYGLAKQEPNQGTQTVNYGKDFLENTKPIVLPMWQNTTSNNTKEFNLKEITNTYFIFHKNSSHNAVTYINWFAIGRWK